MALSLPVFGSDGLGVWNGGAVAFASSPKAGITDGGHDVVTCFDGRLDNREELVELLGDMACSPMGATDSDLVLALATRLGDAFLSRLAGDFALAVWHRRERSRGALFLSHKLFAGQLEHGDASPPSRPTDDAFKTNPSKCGPRLNCVRPKRRIYRLDVSERTDRVERCRGEISVAQNAREACELELCDDDRHTGIRRPVTGAELEIERKALRAEACSQPS